MTGSAPAPAPTARPADPPGRYPTGTAGSARDWDGHAWAPIAVADPDAPDVANTAPFVLRTRRFWLAAVAVAIASALAAVASGLGPSGRWLAGLAGALGVGGTLLALTLAVWQRLRLRAAVLANGWSLRGLIGLGVVSGIVAVVLAYVIEVSLRGVSGEIGGLFLAGPVEETTKLLVPVIAYLAVRRRLADPRVGFALVWVSATVFGFAEGIEYLLGIGKAEHLDEVHGVDREIAEVAGGVMLTLSRSITEMIHPLMTAAAAAVMWLGAWRGRGLLTGAGLLAYLTAIVLHSVNDGVIGGLIQQASPTLGLLLWPAFVVLIYQVFRIHTRELVPPASTEISPRRWRPRIRR